MYLISVYFDEDTNRILQTHVMVSPCDFGKNVDEAANAERLCNYAGFLSGVGWKNNRNWSGKGESA